LLAGERDQFDTTSNLFTRPLHVISGSLIIYIKRNLIDQTQEDSLFNAVSNIVLNIPEKVFKKSFDVLLGRMQFYIDNEDDRFEHLVK